MFTCMTKMVLVIMVRLRITAIMKTIFSEQIAMPSMKVINGLVASISSIKLANFHMFYTYI